MRLVQASVMSDRRWVLESEEENRSTEGCDQDDAVEG